MIIVRLACAALAVALLAGCSAPGASAAPPPPSAASPAAETTITTPTPQGAPLTIKQAALLFARIMAPLGRAISAFAADANGQPPFSQFKTDGRALIAAVRVSAGQLAAANWPAQVQPDIASMLTTYEPAEIACTQAQISAGSYAAAQVASTTNVQCGEASQDETVSTIRTILGIPV